MPIITQLNATKLRSLKYGNDTSDGGNSGQPYVKPELKDINKPFTKFRLTKFDDGLIRGGAIGALNASIVDTIRIGKFLKDFPKGPLFIAKQVGLQLSNPKLETKKGVSGLLGNIGPTRLYNLGINTIAQVPLNAFGGHLIRHGLLPVMDESTKYINVVTENNREEINTTGGGLSVLASYVGSSLNPSGGSNRLVALTNKFNLGDNEGDISRQFNLQEARRENRENNRAGRQANREANRQGRQDNRVTNQTLRQYYKENGGDFYREKFTRTDFKRNKLDTKTLTIDSYNGGPNSVYGIGRTIINRYVFTEDKIKINDAIFKSKLKTISGSLSFDPLTTESGFISESGEWITGSTPEPISTFASIFANIEEDNQFKALGRKKQPKDFIYVTTTPQNWLIPDNSLIDTGSLKEIKSPSVKVVTSTPSDKFNVIKSTKEDTDYTKNTRDISSPAIIEVKDQGPQTTIYTGKTQAEADAKAAASLDSITQLPEITVVPPKKVKASIVNVKPMEGGEFGLEETYKTGSMVSLPITKIEHTTNNGKAKFKTEEVSLNRGIDEYNSFYYLNGRKTVPNFNRNDRDILLVSFTPINPFDATDLRNVVMVAYMSGFKYNSNSTWNPVKYVGRSESFYTFTEHKRDVSFNLQIPCFNPTELREKHRGLGELLAIGAGTYSDSNRLGGVITKLTLGSYLVEEPGILTSVSFDIPDVSSWDLDDKLAMYINASFSFTLIGKELPTYDKKIQGGFFKNVPNAIDGYLGSTNAI